MTPKGVEHTDRSFICRSVGMVMNAVTPKGVEHNTLTGGAGGYTT
ncbi:hypothetical protein FRUB_10174 [Fimbriiglobus ruber]|uniref:Uncharacterized protein n=1 Tax=Fimbriiglobus ruber TaxID=1908690 RepID=A0A225CZU2_9BACT|nr:hypothetical protein FRUB_10174 [Fimbriiglobus ruber]